MIPVSITQKQYGGYAHQTVHRMIFPLVICLALFLQSGLPVTDTVAATPVTRICASRALERRSKRFVRIGRPAFCTPRSMGASSSSSNRSVSSSSSSAASSSASARPIDPLSDTSIRSQHLLLGETGPVVGAINIFLEAEPLDVRSIAVNVNIAVPSVQAFLLYDETRHLLGRATMDPSVASGRTYRLQLQPETLIVDRRGNVNVYARPQLLPKDLGGTSNHLVEIGNIVVEGNGVWSSQRYTKGSIEAFLPFVTARSVITRIANAGGSSAPLSTGIHREIGAFRAEGRTTDASAHIDITDLQFEVESTGGAAVTNVTLRSEGLSEEFPCSVSASTVTCAAIPQTYGALQGGPRTLTLYGDVTITDPQHASLRLTLNSAGTPTSDGAVRWSDGSATFGWLGKESPLAMGTVYK